MNACYKDRACVGLTLLAVSCFAFADDGWSTISTSIDGNTRWDGKVGSAELRKNKSNEEIVLLVGRIADTKESTINVYQWYVTLQDCKNGKGKVVTLDISGDYLYDFDFVPGAGNVAAILGETVCGVAERLLKIREGKGV